MTHGEAPAPPLADGPHGGSVDVHIVRRSVCRFSGMSHNGRGVGHGTQHSGPTTPSSRQSGRAAERGRPGRPRLRAPSPPHPPPPSISRAGASPPARRPAARGTPGSRGSRRRRRFALGALTGTVDVRYCGPHQRRSPSMADDADAIGPVSYLIVEFPGNKMTGEGLPILVDLVDQGVIRILDFLFVMRGDDGSLRGVEITDIDHDGQLDLAIFEGATSGLIDETDLDDAAAVVEPGSSAAILLFENTLGPLVHSGPAQRRGRGGGRRLCPARRHRGVARRRRSRRRLTPRKDDHHARTPARRRPHRRRGGHRDRRVEPSLPPAGQPLVRPGGAAVLRTAAAVRTAAPRTGARSGGAAADPIEQLKDLAELKAQGILTEAEFEAQKAKNPRILTPRGPPCCSSTGPGRPGCRSGRPGRAPTRTPTTCACSSRTRRPAGSRPPRPRPPSPGPPDPIARLRDLAQLHETGALNDAEFARPRPRCSARRTTDRGSP